MAMETLAMAPSPLLLDSLLASSWTWLALCLATIATVLRAVRSSFRRRLPSRSPEQEPPPSSASPSPSCSEAFERELRRRRRRRSKSTSALELLQYNPEEFLCSPLDFLRDHVVRKVTSASRICSEHDSSCKPVYMSGLGADKACLDQDLGLGFQASNIIQTSDRKSKEEKSLGCFFSENESEDDDASCQFLLPEWAVSLCDFVQNSFQTFGFCESSSSSLSGYGCVDGQVSSKTNKKLTPGFEKQSGWENILHDRLGSSWRCQVEPSSNPWHNPCSNINSLSQQPDDVVKLWSPQEKKLMQTLKVDEASAMALDLHTKEGFACFGFGHGEPEAAVWDLNRQSCINSCISSGNSLMPVSALSVNPDAMVTVLGNRSGFGLWEHSRSPNCTMLQTQMTAPLVGLKSRDNAVCVAHANGLFSMYDLRKLDGGNILNNLVSRVSSSETVSPKPVEDSVSFLLEKMSSDAEEDAVEDWFSYGSLDAEKPSSFASFCSGFLRSLSTSTV